MRPNKFYLEVTKAIEYKLKTGSNKKFTPYLIKLMERDVNERQIEEGNFQSGEETYGYENSDSVMNNLEYISDRWRCSYRLRWLLDGIKKGYI